MDVSSRGLPQRLMDLSKGFSVARLPHSHTQPLDMTKKPEWYHRQPQNCGPELSSPYRTSSLRPDLNQDPANYINSPLTPGLDLYHDTVHNNLWHSGFYETSGNAGPESSGAEEEEEEEEDSDSDSDVIFLVSSAKEPLLCTTFLQDNVTHIVEPLSPSSLDEGRGCYDDDLPQSSPSRDSSYSDESSESSVDIPIHHARPIVLLSDLSAVYAEQSPPEVSSDESDVSEVTEKNKKFSKRTHKRERNSQPKRSCQVRKASQDTPPLTPRRSLRRLVKNNSVGLYNESYDSDDVLDFVARISSSDESIPRQKNAQRMTRKLSKSNLKEKSPSVSPEREETSQCKQEETKRTVITRKKAPMSAKELSISKPNCKEPTEKRETQRTIKKRKRKRKFKQNGPSNLFTIEPEIALKYAYRKKRERKFDSFSPFVRVEEQICTVVNYHEEEKKPAPSQNAAGFVPTTSCYNLGRISMDSTRSEYLKCCLCGQTANANTLGDLHGPYYPAFSDGQDARTVQNGHDESPQEESGFQNTSVKEEEAVVNETLNLEECWMHEDCGVWSTGVFLVRGKVYGLKEAALLAQQTTCCLCLESGAIVGCFQKGCSRTFHVSCAVQSGCALNEDNFSMRCFDHKAKQSLCEQTTLEMTSQSSAIESGQAQGSSSAMRFYNVM
ncbi:hypothetical protein WMY93_003269 [Mugilogobius chulae]|uniref:PHD-type domain-containing protein n=1 Tax=Mugilogobius chulae TaxID=88201 RepID=A0AAW0PXS4_9GOBI